MGNWRRPRKDVEALLRTYMESAVRDTVIRRDVFESHVATLNATMDLVARLLRGEIIPAGELLDLGHMLMIRRDQLAALVPMIDRVIAQLEQHRDAEARHQGAAVVH